MSEAQEQAALIAWCRHPATVRAYPGIDEIFHVPNGGSRNAVEARNLKRQGVVAGQPDLLLLAPRGCFCGLAIELKAGKGKLTLRQSARLAQLAARGYFAVMCVGWEAARQTIIDYFSLPERNSEEKS